MIVSSYKDTLANLWKKIVGKINHETGSQYHSRGVPHNKRRNL